MIVTKSSGAAVRNLLRVIGRRWRASEILIAPSRVQGAGAAAEVVAALALANRVAGADLIIVARGGGSLEDLWTFDEEAMARAIVASRLPVVSAIGHEIDVTIADLAADRRALTPSEAGEICVPDAEEVRRTIDHLAQRLDHSGRALIQDARTRLNRLADRAAARSPATSTAAATASPGSPPASRRSAPWPSSPAATASPLPPMAPPCSARPQRSSPAT